MTYDVAIAGAGIGGAYLARLLAQKKFKVALIDKISKENIGHNWSDSIERAQIERIIDADSLNDLGFAVEKFIIRAPDGTGGIEFTKYPYLIIDRKKLAKKLLQDAINAGAEFFQTEALFPLFDDAQVFGVGLKKDGDVQKIAARITVDATGIKSILRRDLPKDWLIDTNLFDDSDCAHAYREIRKIDANAPWPPLKILIYRYGRFRGYSWVHRESESAIDIGFGMPATVPLENLKTYVQRESEGIAGVKDKMIRGGGGKLPVRRPISNFVANGFVAIGDSASQAHPLLGCNTGSIILAADFAAEAIEKSLASKKFGIDTLWSYNAKFMRSRGAALASLDALRRALQNVSEEEIGWLLKKGVLGRPALTRSLEILPPKLEISELVSAALGALSRTKLMVLLAQSSSAARDVFLHFRNYPETFDKEAFSRWQSREKSLFKSILEMSKRR